MTASPRRLPRSGRLHQARALLPDPGAVTRQRRRGICGLAGHPGLERGFPADDWRHIPPAGSTISRSSGWRPRERHPAAARHSAADRRRLPRILQELKARGYRIVHVVPATAERPATATVPQQWLLHPPSETIAISRWPKNSALCVCERATLPAPVFSDLDWRDSELIAHARRTRGVPLPRPAPWPQPRFAPINAASILPVPAASVFKSRKRCASRCWPPIRRSVTRSAAGSRDPVVSARSRGIVSRQVTHLRSAAQHNPRAGHSVRGVSKQPGRPENARAVRLASLKKR